MVLIIMLSAACRPTTEEETIPDATEAVPFTPSATAVAQQTAATPQPTPTVAPPPPPKPTPQPTTSIIAINGQRVGGESAGMEIAMPPGWTNISGELDTSAAANPLGLSVLLLADSERTGRSLLAGKELNDGAFAVGLITNQPIPANAPTVALTQLISNLGTAVDPLNQAQTTTANAADGPITGAVLDVTGDPLDFFGGDDNLRARLALFPFAVGDAPDGRTAAIFLFSAPASQWERYVASFDQMADTIMIHKAQTGYALRAGAANVVGDLTGANSMNGKLDQGVKDVWTFTIAEAQYATVNLAPDDNALDLTLIIIGPAGQTIVQADSGYAGDTEIAADVLLTESGRYAIEISDFFGEAGRYTLSLSLDAEPQHNDAGKIWPGQGIQSVLPVNAQHIWTFDGTAGNLVSVVLTPNNNQMDAILNLYGPDGQRLVALDEGFSGDAEVISGYELPVTGVYSILVSSFSSAGGAYTLALDEGGEATQNFHDAGDLAYDNSKSETLRNSEAHAWFFQGRAGDAVNIVVRPLNDLLDLEVWLFDPDIQRLAAQDEFAAGDSEGIELTLPDDGQYLILVREFFGEAGGYEINLTAAPATAPTLAGRVNYGETISGELAPGEAVIWQFSGDQNDVIDIELSPANATQDVVFALQDPEGNIVLELDEALPGQSERLTSFTIMTDGQWGIVVKDFFDEGLAYSLTVQRAR
ncbi:MAG: hypothetical protein GY803_24180 [Chloroflexi bacterium]|nr:hypothetical protein [Chloroflexota bacterium]